MPVPAPIRLSKSKFVAGIQCLKRLYFQVRQPELADEVDEGQEARLEQGQEVGRLAQSRFSGGALVGFEGGVDRPRNRWRLIEVKSSLEVKPHYLYDVAIQHHVLSTCGLDIS